jgi:hypothetical protein
MPSKEPRQPKASHEQPRKPEKQDRRPLADDELETVSGGLVNTGGVVSDSVTCISQL